MNKMKTIFLNSKNSSANEKDFFRLYLSGKLNLRDRNKKTSLKKVSIYYTWKNIKSICNNNKFKISSKSWNESVELADGSYLVKKYPRSIC